MGYGPVPFLSGGGTDDKYPTTLRNILVVVGGVDICVGPFTKQL